MRLFRRWRREEEPPLMVTLVIVDICRTCGGEVFDDVTYCLTCGTAFDYDEIFDEDC
jgi:hypothetical protein